MKIVRMTDEFPDQIEMENRIRSNEALDEATKRYRKLVGAIKAQAIADMIRAYFPDENCIMTYDEAVEYYKKIVGKR
jgi:hypothetical protein